MNIQQTEAFLSDFVDRNQALFGSLTLSFAGPLQAASFPDELHKLGAQCNGLYLIWSHVEGNPVRYVGIATDIPRRIYQHIGKGFRWVRNGESAHFPQCTLASPDKHWLDPAIREELCQARWSITCVFPSDPAASSLLESAVLYWSRQQGEATAINVAL